MPSKLSARAARMAQTDPVRRQIWHFLTEQRVALKAAAKAGAIPVTAVSSALIERFGAEALAPPIMRQFIGIGISDILQQEGFIVARTGVRLRQDPLFGAGSLFEQSRVETDEGQHSLLARLIDTLNADELAFAEERIRQRLLDLPPTKGQEQQIEDES